MMGSGTDIHTQQIACQELLKRDGVCSGWLRGKTILHKLGEAMDEKMNRPGFAKQLTSMISWQRRYVVVSDGYLYIYTSETSKRPAKVIDLCWFQTVERDDNLKVSDIPWPIKVSSNISPKVMNYGAMSEPEMKKWIEGVTKGIDEAKTSGRKPVVVCDRKESNPNRPTRSEKPLPSIPSVPDDSEEGTDSDYDYIPDQNEENNQTPKKSTSHQSSLSPLPGESSSSSGHGFSTEYEINTPNVMHPKVEPKKSILSRKEIALPPTPVEISGAAPANLKKVPPKPAAAPTTKPAVPVKNSKPNLDKKPVPKVPVPINTHSDEDDNVEYELMDDSIVVEATWIGPPEEGTEKMKLIREEGVFMIRDSTTGNGDKTLQVLSDDAVRKYKIVKEGNKFRMAGGDIFDSMAELLTFYQINSIPNHATKLTKPYSKA